MGKAKPPASAGGPPRSASWLSSRQRKKCWRLSVFVLLPITLAFLVAFLAAPEQPPLSSAGAAVAAAAEEEEEEEQLPVGQAPPVDLWSKPSECLAWAGDGQCKANPGFMSVQCAWSCHKLELGARRYRRRCPRPEHYPDALAAGEMNATFARALSAFPELQPEQISADPPIILFHNFLQPAEMAAFRVHGKGRYEKSLGVGMKDDGTMGDLATEIRTSSHGWCNHADCLNDPQVQSVVRRVSDITRTPETNAEFAQLVYYHGDGKQFYKEHNDYIEGDLEKMQGVRIFTLFAYLNDVPEGGGTRFTKLPADSNCTSIVTGMTDPNCVARDIPGSTPGASPVTFQPKAGKAILWPSVLAGDPHTKDSRTDHEALPVTVGEKFGANFWIHQHDFKGAYAKGCTAS